MERIYDLILKSHFESENKMAFISGPRQVGKTTTSKAFLPEAKYFNWDVPAHREIILSGPEKLYGEIVHGKLVEGKVSVIFDEIHKFPRWKNFLKGFFDLYKERINICVTGSARLSTYKYGGDSLMGRYFPYRMHPISVRELAPHQILSDNPVQEPVFVAKEKINHLLTLGGFPEPFLRADQKFYNKWIRLRLELLFKEDLRDLKHVTDIGRIRTLADLLNRRASCLVNYSNLANDLQVSVDTIRRWIDILEEIYFCFRLRPYSKKINRSILREPKIYMCDWSNVNDLRARYENFIASHLLKWVNYLTDCGFGNYELFYLRDKEHREVDFCVTRDQEPWLIVEAKHSDENISDSLHYFQKKIDAPHAFQVIYKMDFVNKSCFSEKGPIKVPASTFLSQLI